jgi:hypothetical protein
MLLSKGLRCMFIREEMGGNEGLCIMKAYRNKL